MRDARCTTCASEQVDVVLLADLEGWSGDCSGRRSQRCSSGDLLELMAGGADVDEMREA